MFMKLQQKMFFVFFCLLSCLAYGKTPYLVLISIDGFRYDYPQKFDLKFMKKLQKQSEHSNELYPVYPTLTFPNHLSTITGTYPDEHGIIGNIFYDKERKIEYSITNEKTKKDPTWYLKEPIWTGLEKKGIISASYYWPGSDVAINGKKPTYSFSFDDSTTREAKLKQTLEWLKMPEDKRPHFISLYFPKVDSLGHVFGPNAEETKRESQAIDKFLKRLMTEVTAVNPFVNFIICSDHGMVEIQKEKVVFLKDLMDLKKPIFMSGNGSLIHLYFKDTKTAEDFYPSIKQNESIKAYLKKDIPENLHLRKGKHTGDIILVAEYPTALLQSEAIMKAHPIKGTHGYDAYKVKEMKGIYFEVGQNFMSKSRVKETRDIYYRIKEVFNQ